MQDILSSPGLKFSAIRDICKASVPFAQGITCLTLDNFLNY